MVNKCENSCSDEHINEALMLHTTTNSLGLNTKVCSKEAVKHAWERVTEMGTADP